SRVSRIASTYILSLHAALPISPAQPLGLRELRVRVVRLRRQRPQQVDAGGEQLVAAVLGELGEQGPRRRGVVDNLVQRDRVDVIDRKSTRLNSSHVKISYAVFC